MSRRRPMILATTTRSWIVVVVVVVFILIVVVVDIGHACDHHSHQHPHSREENQYDIATTTTTTTTTSSYNNVDDEQQQQQQQQQQSRQLDNAFQTWWQSFMSFSKSPPPSSYFQLGDKKWSSRMEFEQSGARCGNPIPTLQEIETTTQQVMEWIQQKQRQQQEKQQQQHQQTRRRKLPQSSIFKTWLANILNGGDDDDNDNDSDDGDDEGDENINDDMITIPTVFHVITHFPLGVSVERRIPDQMDILNAVYEPHGFSFQLQNITVTENPIWYAVGQADVAEQREMKRTLKRGSGETLNVYLLSPSDGTLGWAQLPWWNVVDDTTDGIIIWNESIVGGSAYPYNKGMTLVHEIGHWLGLFHTFEGIGCYGTGDAVQDTPHQKQPTYGCPARKNTCRVGRGMDPIHNYMDYSDDSCMNEFTNDQVVRMKAIWNLYRAPQPERRGGGGG